MKKILEELFSLRKNNLRPKEQIFKVYGCDVAFACFSPDPHWIILISLGFGIQLDAVEKMH